MSAPPQAHLHRNLSALLALCAIGGFVSGAGADAPALLPTSAMLMLSLFWHPSERLRRGLELCWRTVAVLLAARAAYHALFVADDVVLPMVDLLLLLLLAETYRSPDGTGDARLYALTFALLIAAAAYRPGFMFAIAFTGYLALLTVSLIVGQLTRQARRRRIRTPPFPRRFLLQSAAYSGVALLVSLVVFVAFPRVGWSARAAAPLRNLVGFGDRVSLLEHGGRLYANPQVVLRVEFPHGERPPPGQLYWRGRSYDTFDGWTWSRTSTLSQPLIQPGGWPRPRIEQLVHQTGVGDANVLFGLSPPLRVDPRSRVVAYAERNGDYTYAGPATPVYSVLSVLGQPAADHLRSARQAMAPSNGGGSNAGSRAQLLQAAALRPYRRLPPLSPRFFSLADSLRRLGATDYDRALAVQNWLRDRFRYTLDLPATASTASLEYFLFERRAGHCEYFSTAMALLLRAMGVPARNVNGFLGGEWNEFGHFLTVTQNQAHSWVEVWFAGFGWVRFDPTPAAAEEIASRGPRLAWLGPFRLLLGGLEHRWGKWVLDYDLTDQGRLLERAARLGQTSRVTPGYWGGAFRAGLAACLALLAVGIAVALVRRWRGRSSGGSLLDISREYLRLRRAFARAGYEGPKQPLAFLVHLEAVGAPARAEAAGAVLLYIRLRFGRQLAGAAQYRRLREQVRVARRVLARSRAGY